MAKDSRRSGFGLTLAGLAGVGFFWATDPTIGVWARSAAADMVDTMHQASPGTWIGICGSAVIGIIGFFLMMRRTI